MVDIKQIDAGELPLRKIFSSDFDFQIPNYQRPYSWQREQALQLLDDLEDALASTDDEPYFLGSVVLVKNKSQAKAEVIDGQQRLTTLTIIIAVLRDLAQDADFKNELRNLVLEPGSLISGTKPKPRLTLRNREAEFFRDYIQTPDKIESLESLDPHGLKTDAQRSIKANATELKNRLSAWTDKRRQDLAALLGSRTFLVVVSTPDLSSAHRIFSVMNSRGLDLSPADIFKSRVIGDVAEEDQGTYAEKWESEEEDLGRDDFGDLFAHIRLIFSKVKARKELLQEFSSEVLDKFLPDEAGQFVDSVMIPYADAYGDLLNESYAAGAHAAEVNGWLKRLHQIDNVDWRTPALWAMRNHREDSAFLAQFLTKLERLAASLLLRRVYATPRINRYAELLKELDDHGMGLDSPSLYLSESEKEETLGALRGEIYTVKPVRRYVLMRLDELLAKQPGVTYHHKLITVEHVLPQHVQPGSTWDEHFSDGEKEYWTHRLANLVLLNRVKNSSAQNYDFDTKKKKYFTGANGVATFALTTQVLECQEWTPETLDKRQASLLKTLATEWELPGAMEILEQVPAINATEL